MKKAVKQFLKKYGVVGTNYTCFYNPDQYEQVSITSILILVIFCGKKTVVLRNFLLVNPLVKVENFPFCCPNLDFPILAGTFCKF